MVLLPLVMMIFFLVVVLPPFSYWTYHSGMVSPGPGPGPLAFPVVLVDPGRSLPGLGRGRGRVANGRVAKHVEVAACDHAVWPPLALSQAVAAPL